MQGRRRPAVLRVHGACMVVDRIDARGAYAVTSSIHGGGATVGQALRLGRRRWQGRMWRLVHVGTATWLVARRQVCAGLVDGAM